MSNPDEQVVHLRPIMIADLDIFFIQQQDPEARTMAAFTARDPFDRAAFDDHYRRILNDDSTINQTILYRNQVAGNIFSFIMFGQREVGYWLGKEFWGKGIATQALSQFLRVVNLRPLFAHAAKDNVASRRVLEKCGFIVIGEDRGFAMARGEEIEELIFRLEK